MFLAHLAPHSTALYCACAYRYQSWYLYFDLHFCWSSDNWGCIIVQMSLNSFCIFQEKIPFSKLYPYPCTMYIHIPYSGKFSLEQIFVHVYIWPKNPQNKFSYVLISYARAMPMQLTYGLQHSIVISLQVHELFSFCFDRTTYQESLGRPLKDLAKH